MAASEDVIAVVTGANRGIGFEIARQLAGRGARVVLTARSAATGEAALARLPRPERAAHCLLLDVSDDASVAAFARELAELTERLDVLVNNAGMILKGDPRALEVTAQRLRQTMETNTLGALRVTQALLPLLRRSADARVINLSSGMGQLDGMEGGWAAYRISKTALNGVTAVLAAELKHERIAVNSMCPGWVRTDMGGPNAPRSIAEGADTAVWLALDAPHELTGKFVRDRQVIAW